MSNFKFLEKINKKLAEAGETAEKLFRDEYFDQCITQTRKFAELMTKDILGDRTSVNDSFEDMIYKLKSSADNNDRELEFIKDMYFLKKQGNMATHGVKIQNTGKVALECLERAFEASINYAVSKTKDKDIDRLIFDEQLLVSGTKNTNLQTQYKEIKQKEKELQKKSSSNKKSSSDNSGLVSLNNYRKKEINKQNFNKKNDKTKQNNKKKLSESVDNQGHTTISLFNKILIASSILALIPLSVLSLINKIELLNNDKAGRNNMSKSALKVNKIETVNSNKSLANKNIEKKSVKIDFSVSKNFSNKNLKDN